MTVSELLSQFTGKRVMVVGDLMLDEYIWGQATRISPEAPVLVVDAQSESQVPGGAANVAHNVVAYNARSFVVGVIGQDLAGDDLRARLATLGIETDGVVIDPARRTTRKTRVIAHHQQVLRVDREHRDPVSPQALRELCENVSRLMPETDAVILSDYRKGALTETLIRHTLQVAGEAGKPVVANPKPSSAPLFSGTAMLSLNRVETEALVGESLESLELTEQVCRPLVQRLGVRSLLVTLGEQGMVVITEEGATPIPAIRVEVYDTAGAGDTVIATAALGLASGAQPKVAARLANLAGGCVVRKVGVAVPNHDELVALANSTQYQL